MNSVRMEGGCITMKSGSRAADRVSLRGWWTRRDCYCCLVFDEVVGCMIGFEAMTAYGCTGEADED